MFTLDKIIFDSVYSACKNLGSVFELGALEGFILYSSMIVCAITSRFSKNK